MGADRTTTDATNPPACRGCGRRDRRIAELELRIVKVEEQVATLSRAAKRQAARFSKGPPKANPKRPVRKAGEDYGTKVFRAVPPTIDQVYEAPLPEHWPHCDGVVLLKKIAHQHQTAIVDLNKDAGLWQGKISTLFTTLCGIRRLRWFRRRAAEGPNPRAGPIHISKPRPA